jgi:hypothetical protein
MATALAVATGIATALAVATGMTTALAVAIGCAVTADVLEGEETEVEALSLIPLDPLFSMLKTMYAINKTPPTAPPMIAPMFPPPPGLQDRSSLGSSACGRRAARLLLSR